MPFLPPNQQRQSIEGIELLGFKTFINMKTLISQQAAQMFSKHSILQSAKSERILRGHIK